MQEHDTFPGKIYAVTSASGCTVTDNKGRSLGEAEAGKQTLFIATSDKLVTSADAHVQQTFNLAPAKLRLLGLLGGGEKYPGFDLTKYAECTKKADMEAADPNYKSDLTKDGKWVYPLPKLTSGDQLFNDVQISAVAVKEFPLLSSGYFMFASNKAIKRFTTRMPKMAWFDRTFHNSSLEIFDYGGETFSPGVIQLGFNACKNFRTFNAVFGKKLSNAQYAFTECILDKPSVLRIANSAIPSSSGQVFHIGIHVDHQNDPEVLDALALMETNGWALTVQWNGTATAQTASTWGLRKPPIYAKVDEVKLSDGTTERMLDWGAYVTNAEERGYMEFASVEEAREYFHLNEQ